MDAFSAAGLDRVRRVLDGHLRRGVVPGAVALLDRGGETSVTALGAAAVGGGPLRRDSIFRISSLTKPIVSVAALTLVEDCVLRLDDPVEELLPELADRRVLTALDAPLTDTVPAERAITVRDLLTGTMGFGQLMADPASVPVLAAAAERSIGVGPPDPAGRPAPDEWLRRLGELPLMSQPGERWQYDTPTDVLGVLVARAAGTTLGGYLAERVLGPLGMDDTGFSVPPDDLERFVVAYGAAPGLPVLDPVDGAWSRPPAFESGAGGLVSTADDLLAFGRMLLAGGGPVLSRASVAAMTTDQLSPAQKTLVGWLPTAFDGKGWGFGVEVVLDRTGPAESPGRFGWYGGLGTSWACDPAEDLVAVLMTQVMLGSPDGAAVHTDFWTTAYAALT